MMLSDYWREETSKLLLPYRWIKLISSSAGIAASGVYLTLTLFLVGLLAAVLRLLGPVSRGDSELWEKGERKIRGHIIASSAELIAIYDTDLHQVRTLSRGDWEIRRVTP
ncbi:hypothetical protein [Xanthomonas citri]|uniref:hypothetical protein n=1 Tax=Xanthomonas citri TaxID=346 RepID=UPI0009B7FE24|nr:hypothetical protein [Xanthomonas citri]WPM78383.1 hypothetical protein XVT_09625 [Xanthomonas citri pv. viticola]